jgi:hypothetical protein
VTSVTVCGFHPILTTLGSKDITLNVFLNFLFAGSTISQRLTRSSCPQTDGWGA